MATSCGGERGLGRGVAVAALPAAAGAAAAAQPIAWWSMDQAEVPGPDGDGNFEPDFFFNGVADRRLDAGEGTLFGGAFAPAEEDNLITFNAAGGLVPNSANVPPASLFNSALNPEVDPGLGFTNGLSFGPAVFSGLDGALFFPQDQHGNEFGVDFSASFAVEFFY